MNLSFPSPQIDCPTDKLDKLDNLPTPTESWIQILTKICLKIQEDCQQNREEEKLRNELLDSLDRIIKEKYINVKLDLFGSSNNGFGMKKSDLDICLTFKDQPQQTVNILSSSSSNSSLFLF